MKRIVRNRLKGLLMGAVLGVFALTMHSVAHAENKFQRFISTGVSYEDVRAAVIEVDAAGNGLLRIYEAECADCFVDVFFDANVRLETPLGGYRGLDKLSNWSDQILYVKVRGEPARVSFVRVESNY